MAQQTFLELCQKTRRLARIPGSGPTTVTGQTGQMLDIVEWVKDAYEAIQNKYPDWRWMRSTFTLTTIASTDTYAYSSSAVVESSDSSSITSFDSWRISDPDDPVKIYLQSSGVGAETYLSFMAWDYFKQIYKRGTQANNMPNLITIDPQNRLVLGANPDAVYIVTGDYRKGPEALSVDADIPSMPSQYHDLIVYYALEHYGYLELAPEVLAYAQKMRRRLMSQLEINQLPPWSTGAPLA